MLSAIIIIAWWGLVLAFARSSGAFALAGRMLSRIFVSGRRRPEPAADRFGGLAGLSSGLAGLIDRQRQLDAAIEKLQAIAPTYHASFESQTTGVLDDRRRQAVRRDFEDAVIHVTRSLDRWCMQQSSLDDQSRAQLTATGPVPDVRGLLREFRWLPREVHQVAPLHFRNDEPAFERSLGELREQLTRLEESLTHQRRRAYR